MITLPFYKTTEQKWYIDYPMYPGPKDDLEMIAGADAMLDIISEGDNKTTLNLSLEHFDNADVLKFKPGAQEEIGGGAYYMMDRYRGIDYNMQIWLCDVTKFVLGSFPDAIYISKAS